MCQTARRATQTRACCYGRRIGSGEPRALSKSSNAPGHAASTCGRRCAQVTLVEHRDFECPNCGQAYPAVKLVRRHFGECVRCVFRHFPLREVHPHADLAAESAEAAGA
ncbi:MAG TPA: thioredoxin domain-containing protein [Casimicrobiaceae bacterium]